MMFTILKFAKFVHKIYNDIKCHFCSNNKAITLNKYIFIEQEKLLNLTIFYLKLPKLWNKKNLDFGGTKLWKEIDKDIKHIKFNSFKKCFKEKVVNHYHLWL